MDIPTRTDPSPPGPARIKAAPMEPGKPIDIDAIEKQFRPSDTAPPPVYSDPPPDPEPDQELVTTAWPSKWTDVEKVKKLSEFLKKCSGFHLMTTENGKLNLHFTSGLDHTDRKRWNKAVKAIEMIVDALDELHFLLETGLLKLPARNITSHPDKKKVL